MRPTKLKGIVELAGVVAILTGLLFVYLEIKQNGDIAYAELVSGSSEKLVGIFEQMSDPEFASLYAKSLHTPADLTESERIQLNVFFEIVKTMFTRELRLSKLGIFDEYEIAPRWLGPKFFGRGYGRAWWNVRKKETNPEIVEVVEEELSKLDVTSDLLDFDNQVELQLDDL